MADPIVNGNQSTEQEMETHSNNPTEDNPTITDNKTPEMTTKQQIAEHFSSREVVDNNELLDTTSNETIMNNNGKDEEIEGSSEQEQPQTSLNIKQNHLNDNGEKSMDITNPNSSQMDENTDKTAESSYNKLSVENPTVVLGNLSNQTVENVNEHSKHEQRNSPVEIIGATVSEESENMYRVTTTEQNESNKQEIANDNCEKRSINDEQSENEKQKNGNDLEVKLGIESKDVKDVDNTKENGELPSMNNEKQLEIESGQNVLKEMQVEHVLESSKELVNNETTEKNPNKPDQDDTQITSQNGTEQAIDLEVKENAENRNELSQDNTSVEIIQPSGQEEAERSPHNEAQVPSPSLTSIAKSEDVQAETSLPAVELRKKEDGTSESGSPVGHEKKERKVSSSIWYTDEAEREALSPKPEGYSTSVVGGVVVRKPIPSR